MARTSARLQSAKAAASTKVEESKAQVTQAAHVASKKKKVSKVKLAAKTARTTPKKTGKAAAKRTVHKVAQDSQASSKVLKFASKTARKVHRTTERRAAKSAKGAAATREVIEIDQDTSDDDHIEIDEEEDEMSAYERQRQANIARNKQLMEAIGFTDLSRQKAAARTAAAERRDENRKLVKEERDSIPRRQSRRVQGQEVEFQAVAELPAVPKYKYDHAADDSDDDEAASWETVPKLHVGAFYQGGVSIAPVVPPTATASYSLDPRDVVKALPSRVYALAFHSAVSDVEGYLALWTPPVVRSNERQDDSCLATFRLHKRAISTLLFQDTALLSSCMGGVVKRLDLANPTAASSAAVVLACDAAITNFQVNQALGCMFLSCDDGSVIQTDLRTDATKLTHQHQYALHDKKINTVHCHPTNPHAFRNSVNCASFSPDGAAVVSVCLDDFVYLHDTRDLSLSAPRKIKHDNHSGQWLTKFHAAWDPKKTTDCEFVLGGNKRPRCIEIFGTTSPAPRQSLADETLFNSVHSLNIFHPTLPFLLGGNSSGRIAMWRQ
ncbi:hypothetical protein B5M09_007302 [Aphanomyces astaci]|uniref:WD repeat-containing protein 76 n=1 Tax=Aphanomyces astaci TaxID=112090 RepID=A0A3R7Y7G3_APHAT|nr:hypothetical protein B5M09_007302 [Aphanomyces astaci]